MKQAETRSEETSGRRQWTFYVVSAVLFLMHKMEGRYPGNAANPAWYPEWHRHMPGLLVSHEPFDTVAHMGMTFCVHLCTAIAILWALRRAFSTLDRNASAIGARLFVVGFTVFWVGFANFETHHIRNLVLYNVYVPGSVFAGIFILWIFLALLPASIRYHLPIATGPRRPVWIRRNSILPMSDTVGQKR